MPITTVNGASVVNENFPQTAFSRREIKASSRRQVDSVGMYDDLVDTDDEQGVVDRTDARRRQINSDFFAQLGLSPLPSRLPGDTEYGRLQTLFGSGAGGVRAFNTPDTARQAVRRLSTNLVPPNEIRTMHRGGSIEAHQAEALLRVLKHGSKEDNHTVSFIMLHGYMTIERTRSKVRPPSVSSDNQIAEEYVQKSANPASRELRFFLTIKGETGDQRAALGASCAFQINAVGEQREFILDDRNTYFTTKVKSEQDRITLYIEVTGQSEIGDRAWMRARNPHDRASISPQALEAGRAAQSAREERANEKTAEDAEFAAGDYAMERSMADIERDAEINAARQAHEYAQSNAGEPNVSDYRDRFDSLYHSHYEKCLPDAKDESFKRLYSDLFDQYFWPFYDEHYRQNYEENLRKTPLW